MRIIPDHLLTPLWVIFIPSVTFEPLCTLNFIRNIRKNMTFTFKQFLGHFVSFFEQTKFFGKNRALSLLNVYPNFIQKIIKKLIAQFWEIIKNVIFRAFFTLFALFWANENPALSFLRVYGPLETFPLETSEKNSEKNNDTI